MKHFLIGCSMILLISWMGLGVVSADDKPVFHFEMTDQQQGPGPLGFPFGLSGGQPRDVVTGALQAQGMNRGDYDKDFTVWNVPKDFIYKSFHPYALSLTYKKDKLMQVTLVQPELSECQNIIAMVQDAVGYLQSKYTFSGENVQPSPHFGTNNCVLYMKPGQCGWQVVAGDYAVSVDSNWKDGKDMSYTGFVAFTYLPLYNDNGPAK